MEVEGWGGYVRIEENEWLGGWMDGWKWKVEMCICESEWVDGWMQVECWGVYGSVSIDVAYVCVCERQED